MVLPNIYPIGSTKITRFRGVFLGPGTPECFPKKGYVVGHGRSGKGYDSVSHLSWSEKGCLRAATACLGEVLPA